MQIVKMIEDPKKQIFKLRVKDKAETIIRYLAKEIVNTEWSGVVFYTTEGSMEDGTFKVECHDILPLNIGSSVLTSHTITPDVARYMTDNPELLTMYQGTIHTHHSMASLFSHTDENALFEEGRNSNHELSLIVNNAGEYTARITRKVLYKNYINPKYKYNTFQDEVVRGKGKKYVNFEAVVLYNELSVSRDIVNIDFKNTLPAFLSPIKDKIEEIREEAFRKANRFSNMHNEFSSRYPAKNDKYGITKNVFEEDIFSAAERESYDADRVLSELKDRILLRVDLLKDRDIVILKRMNIINNFTVLSLEEATAILSE